MTRRHDRNPSGGSVGRRKFLFGSGVAAATLVIGSGAFSQVRAEQRVNIGTAGDQGAYLQIVPKEDNQYAWLDNNDELNVKMDKLRRDSETTFDALLEVRNEGTEDVGLYVEEGNVVGDILSFKIDGNSIVGDSGAVELPVGEAVDISVVVDLLDNTAEDLPDDGELDVVFVADADVLDEGGEEGSDGGNSGDGSGDGGGESGSLAVNVPGTVNVGGGNTAEITATVSGGGSGGSEATVTLEVEGEQVEQKTAQVPEGGETDVVFSVPTVHNDVGSPSQERHGNLRFDGTGWTVTADVDGTTDTVEGSLNVEDAPIAFYEPDTDTSCPVCGMMTKMYEGWHAQATHADGTRFEFCSTGCLVTYVVDHTQYDGDITSVPDSPIEGAWVVDFDERPAGGTELIDAYEARFVEDYDTGSKFMTPMSGSPPAFSSHEAAVAYVDGYDGTEHEELTENDIFTIEEFDDAMANEYRPNFHSA